MKNKRLTGYAAVFDNLDSLNDIINKGAFSLGKEGFVNMPILNAHNYNEPIGRVLKAEEDDYGLFITFEVFGDLTKGGEMLTIIKNKMRVGLSIGYQIEMARIARSANTEIRYLQQLTVMEISLTTNPANSLAIIRGKHK